MGLGQHQAMAILKRVNDHHAVSTLVLVQFERWNFPGKKFAEDEIRFGQIVIFLQFCTQKCTLLEKNSQRLDLFYFRQDISIIGAFS